jgi:signal transduction histidine kinase
MSTSGAYSSEFGKTNPMSGQTGKDRLGPHLAHVRHGKDALGMEQQRKDDFLSMASHELKTPITTLKAFLQLVSSGDGPEVIVSKAHLHKMVDQVDRLTRLVTDLLEVSKIQKGQIDFQQELVAVDPLVQEVLAEARTRHQSHRFTLMGASGRNTRGDRARLAQALTELLNNAVKFSPDSDLIEVTIGSGPSAVEITVCDHGIGMQQGEEKRIFERYYRVLVDPAKPFPGLGVGLYIVSEIVRHHGGSVSVSSIAGQGSAFTMSLPVAGDQDHG